MNSDHPIQVALAQVEKVRHIAERVELLRRRCAEERRQRSLHLVEKLRALGRAEPSIDCAQDNDTEANACANGSQNLSGWSGHADRISCSTAVVSVDVAPSY